MGESVFPRTNYLLEIARRSRSHLRTMSVIRAATVHNHNRSRRTSSSESPTGGADQEDHDSSQVFEQRGTDVNGIDSERDPGDQGKYLENLIQPS